MYSPQNRRGLMAENLLFSHLQLWRRCHTATSTSLSSFFFLIQFDAINKWFSFVLDAVIRIHYYAIACDIFSIQWWWIGGQCAWQLHPFQLFPWIYFAYDLFYVMKSNEWMIRKALSSPAPKTNGRMQIWQQLSINISNESRVWAGCAQMIQFLSPFIFTDKTLQ